MNCGVENFINVLYDFDLTCGEIKGGFWVHWESSGEITPPFKMD